MTRKFIIMLLGMMFASVANADDFILSSASFTNNTKIPAKLTCDSGGLSPDLQWKNASTNTKSFALIVSIADYSRDPVYLWVLYNIPKTENHLLEGTNDDLPSGTLEGQNYFGRQTIYRGPCPADNALHKYIFTLYALDTTLNLAEDADTGKVLQSMQGHILQKAQLIGLYQHDEKK